MGFIVIAIVMLLVAAGFVAWPLLRGREAKAAATDFKAVRESRLAELERDVESGALDQAAYEAARKDLESELAQSEAVAETTAAGGGRRRGIAAGVSLVFVLALSVGLYLHLGDWKTGYYGEHAATQQTVEGMVQTLAERLKKKPNDLKGWLMLGRSYTVMGKYKDAVDALTHANTLSGGSSPEVLSSLGEAMVLADPQNLNQTEGKIFAKALDADPNNIKALWYGGLIARSTGDDATAIKRWRTLMGQNIPERLKAVVKEQITKLGGDPTPLGATPSPAGASGMQVTVNLSIDPALKAQLKPGESLFVFIHEPGKVGPPLAVKRLAANFPQTVTLSDANAMIPGVHLADHKQLEVVARVSASGSPIAQTGDMTGKVVIKTGADKAVVNIRVTDVTK